MELTVDGQKVEYASSCEPSVLRLDVHDARDGRGGMVRFWQVNYGYFQTQAAGTTSALFGAQHEMWTTTLVWLVTWTLLLN